MIPLRFIETNAGNKLLFTADNGRAFFADEPFLHRYLRSELSASDLTKLKQCGLRVDENALSLANYFYLLAQRLTSRATLNYFILVPTLRCNMSCTYCQVSRADIKSKGFDWTEDIFERALAFVANSPNERIKVEFQGGEPTLRTDLIRRFADHLAAVGKDAEVVICTNLMELSPELEELLKRENVFISTSIDGSVVRQAEQRSRDIKSAEQTFKNIDRILNEYGPSKLSALPTINPSDPPEYSELYEVFAGRGLSSIFLRPINFQGFARKNHPESRNRRTKWSKYYAGFIDYLILRGAENGYSVSEFYFAQCLKRIFSPRENGHVDLRNPNFLGADYVVIDYDGRIYPTDEARMLDRIGEVDLSIGNLWNGLNRSKLEALNAVAFNNDDPDCIHCAFQPFCGGDSVDTIARHGRIDAPKMETAFCQNQMDVFSKIFSILAAPSKEEKQALTAWLGLPTVPSKFLETFSDSAIH